MGKQFSLSTLPAKRGFQYLRGKPGSQKDRVGGVRAPANHLLFFPRNIFKLKPTHFLRSALFALYHHTCQQLPTSKAGSRSLLFSKIRVFKTLRPALLLPNFNPIREKKHTRIPTSKSLTTSSCFKICLKWRFHSSDQTNCFGYVCSFLFHQIPSTSLWVISIYFIHLLIYFSLSADCFSLLQVFGFFFFRFSVEFVEFFV